LVNLAAWRMIFLHNLRERYRACQCVASFPWASRALNTKTKLRDEIGFPIPFPVRAPTSLRMASNHDLQASSEAMEIFILVSSSCDSSDCHSRGAQFEFRPGHLTMMTEVFHDFAQSLQINAEIGHSRFLSLSLYFIAQCHSFL
jgi:hypothetical protein